MNKAILLAGIVLAAVVAGCGGSAVGPSASSGSAEAGDSTRLPDIEVEDLSGGSVRLTDLAPSDKPMLVWFWAPHCPSCHAEAPDVEAFSQRSAEAVKVVGLGAQDDIGMARDFVDEHDLKTPRMLYDPTFESWRHFGINGQPAAILFDRDGVARERWFGSFPEDEVLSLAREL